MAALTVERLLSQIGLGSRKECRALIRMGSVKIGAQFVENPFEVLSERPEKISVNGEEVSTREKIYGVLHKPLGYECSLKPQHHPSAFSLLPARFLSMEVRFAGRLDVDTSGMILFSNDGDFIHRIESPKVRTMKRYRASLARAFTPCMEKQLLEGVKLHGERSLLYAKRLERINEKCVLIDISEGRYHQVRRMFAAVGNHVETLARESIGSLSLDVLDGEWRELSLGEISQLLSLESSVDASGR